jgi:hypothetical protein
MMAGRGSLYNPATKEKELSKCLTLHDTDFHLETKVSPQQGKKKKKKLSTCAMIRVNVVDSRGVVPNQHLARCRHRLWYSDVLEKPQDKKQARGRNGRERLDKGPEGSDQ